MDHLFNQAFDLSTRQMAELFRVTPAVLYQHRHHSGSYFGITARRLPNGRLLWNRAEALALALASGAERPTLEGLPGAARAFVEDARASGLPLTKELVSFAIQMVSGDLEADINRARVSWLSAALMKLTLQLGSREGDTASDADVCGAWGQLEALAEEASGLVGQWDDYKAETEGRASA